MDSSSSDLEFFDFKNSSDEEIKEIQAILKGPGSNGCVKLPWEISVKSNYTGSLPENKDETLETHSESTKASKDVDEPTAQTLSFVTPETSLPPVAQLPPPTVETFVSLPTTVGPYQNAPYFVSRTIPYLRYPPMGVPFFACPMPSAGEANPYGQFVPMVPERPLDNEPSPKSRDRQSSRRSSKKRLSEGSETIYSEGSPAPTCPTSVPLVPLPVPPATFVGGNLPLGYPPGLHTLQASSPAMYYVPVFNHPYGGYLPPSGPPMMLPVNVAPELKCSPHITDRPEDILQTDNGGLQEVLQANSAGSGDSPQAINGGPGESPLSSNGGPVEFSQTTRNGGPGELHQTDPSCKVILADNDCIDESLLTDNGSSDKVLQASYSPVVSHFEETTPNVQSDCEVCDIVETQPVHPTAKIDVPNMEERIDSSDSLSAPLSEGSCTNCFQETEKCLEEIVPSKVPLVETVTPEALPAKTVPTEAKACRPATEKVKPVVRDQSRCWADLFKSPSPEVNGFEIPPRQRPDKKSTLNNGKRDITNGKAYSVPASNSFH